MRFIDGEKLTHRIIDELCDFIECGNCQFFDGRACLVAKFINKEPSVEVIAEPPLRSDGIVSEHSNGTVSMSKQTWEDVKNEMIPKFIINKSHEELRQAYKELLSDNQTLMADNRKLRAEVEELKRVNEGYTKVLAKSQDTVNKLMLMLGGKNE